MKWGNRFVSEIMRMATIVRVPTDRAIGQLRPRLGVRFIGADSTSLLVDTDSLLVHTADSIRVAVMVFAWNDLLGRRHRAVAHMPFAFEGHPDADSTLQLLRRIPPRL